MNSKKIKIFNESQTARLPDQPLYQRSFMHRNIVSHVLTHSESNIIITCSNDGFIKFWKRSLDTSCIDFLIGFHIYHYSSGIKKEEMTTGIEDDTKINNSFLCLSMSEDGRYLSTIGTLSSGDIVLKLFDLVNLDMVNMKTLDFKKNDSSSSSHSSSIPSSVSLVKPKNQRELEIWIAHENCISILQKVDLEDKQEIKFDFIISQIINNQDTMIIVDNQGKIYYWDIETKREIQDFPKETHLQSESVDSLKIFPVTISNCKRWFAYLASDRQVRIFRFSTGRLYRKYDESLNFYEKVLVEKPTDFTRRIKLEGELSKSFYFSPSCCFDDSGEFIFIPSPLGVKVIHLESNKLVSVIGSKEQNIRIHQIALYQGSPKSEIGNNNPISLEMMTSNNPALEDLSKVYPMLVCTAWNKQRFYLFTQQPPNKVGQRLDRDVMNEAPLKDTQSSISTEDKSANTLTTDAVIRTNFGDIPLTLFPHAAPLAVENFCALARKGYYNNLLFHRIIPNFMIQTGDPLNNGTGGTSIWNKKFPDEIVPTIKFDKSFRLAMANSGKDSNGSQFFVTITKCSWLDGKHTIFGEVREGDEGESGRETTINISKQERDKMDRPLQDIKIIDIVLK